MRGDGWMLALSAAFAIVGLAVLLWVGLDDYRQRWPRDDIE